MLTLSSTGQVCRALAAARRINVSAYTLHGAVLRAVEAAARRGASVSVELEGRPYHDAKRHLAAENQRLARELRAAGAYAALGHPLHAKAIAADSALYLDGKNFSGDDVLLRATGKDIATIPMDKRDALALEAGLFDDTRAGDGPIVESESFGSFNAVERALRDLAQRGGSPRLLVSRRDLRKDAAERRVLDELSGQGVRVRVCDDSEKLAVAGNRAWLGSANATSPYGRGAMTDWGVCTRKPQIVREVRSRLETQWRNAAPLVRAVPHVPSRFAVQA
jgi:hypothetical protein